VSVRRTKLERCVNRCVNCSYHNTVASALYEQRLQRSEFALMILSGDAPNSRRIFDAFAYGAVPIVISDRPWHVAMPFAGKVSSHLMRAFSPSCTYAFVSTGCWSA